MNNKDKIKALYSSPVNFILVWTVYHALIILFTSFIPDIPIHVFWKFTIGMNNIDALLSLRNAVYVYLLMLVILMLDLAFIFFIRYEFKLYWLTVKKVTLLETMLFVSGFIIPPLREIMVFLSINSLIIGMYYYIMKAEKKYFGTALFQYLMITGGIIYIARLVLYPILVLIRLGMNGAV